MNEKTYPTYDGSSLQIIGQPPWRLMDVRLSWADMKSIGFWHVLYGFDLFFNGVPVVKTVLVVQLLLRLL